MMNEQLQSGGQLEVIPAHSLTEKFTVRLSAVGHAFRAEHKKRIRGSQLLEDTHMNDLAGVPECYPLQIPSK